MIGVCVHYKCVLIPCLIFNWISSSVDKLISFINGFKSITNYSKHEGDYNNNFIVRQITLY